MERVVFKQNASKVVKSNSLKDRLKKEKERMDRVEKKVWNFFTEIALEYGYEERDGQSNMAYDICAALRERKHFVIEAGVGIGKSFGYLVPLMYWHLEYGKPIAIATSTIALQEQLAEDIKEVSKMIGYNIDFVLAKGQTHFICKQKAAEYTGEHEEEIRGLAKQKIKERKEMPFITDQIWNKINVEYNYKVCDPCKYKKDCYYFNLRKDMNECTGIILCNQDLLTVHYKNYNGESRSLLNSHIDVNVIDEAHNLEEKVRGIYTISYGQKKLMDTVKEINRGISSRVMGTDMSKYTELFLINTQNLYRELALQIEDQISSDPQLKEAERFFIEFTEEVDALIDKQKKLLGNIYNIIGLYYDESTATETLRQAENEFEEILDFFENIKDAEAYLVWLEKRDKRTEIYVCPKHIDRITRNLYFNNSRITILTSATLTSSCNDDAEEEQYEYFIRNTGFPYYDDLGDLGTPQPSPFPYDQHAMIYYTANLPHPTEERELFIEEGTKIVIDLIKISGGKALILFTSKEDMRAVYRKLSESDLPYKILLQRAGSSQEETLAEFREDVSSVLLGTGAYWEGIDIKGISLSNVIIFRLPFPVPDPIIQYKCSIAQDKFMDVLVPDMIIKLKQGIGRLIRSSTDKGIVSIIDPRLSKESKYTNIVWDSLPIKNKTDSITELKRFYDNVVNPTKQWSLRSIFRR